MNRAPAIREIRPNPARPCALSAVSEPPPEDDRRLLRVTLAVAALVHLGLLFLPMPWTGVEAAPEPPPHVVHALVNVRLAPPPPPPTDLPPAPPEPPATPIPVPEWVVDEPPVDEPPPLPAPEPVPDAPVIVYDAPPPPAPPAPADPADQDGPIYIVGAVEPPVAIDQPRPLFPEMARRVGRDGLVIVQVVIDRDGLVRDVEVLRPAPYGMTEAAVDAVKRWRFEPARLDGEPVAVFFQLTVRFTIH